MRYEDERRDAMQRLRERVDDADDPVAEAAEMADHYLLRLLEAQACLDEHGLTPASWQRMTERADDEAVETILNDGGDGDG